MNETTGQEVWYLARDGKQHGPLSDVEMTKLVELGHLRETDLVWRPGFSDWRPAPSVFDSLSPPAPQPPPPPYAGPTYGTAEEAAPSPAEQTHSGAAQTSAEVAPATYASQIETTSSGMSGSVDPHPVAAEPHHFTPDSGATHPSVASHFGNAPKGPKLGTSDTFRDVRPEEPLHREPKAGGSNRGAVVFVAVLALIGGISAAGYAFRDSLTETLASLTSSSPAPEQVAEVPVIASDAPSVEPAPTQQAEEPAAVATAAVEPTPEPAAAEPVTADPSGIDASLQKSAMWALLKTDFPDWYSERVRDIGRMTSEQKSEDEINATLTEAIVALRRQNAEKALAASPQSLQQIATAFVANLSALQNQSVDACYGFISKGETTPAAASLVQNPVDGAALHAQLQAVFAAVTEGGKSPTKRTPPEKSDYDLLAAELGTIGWSQADIQLFADPKALSEAPRDRVCKMVRDWFSAHIAVKDDAARERLLFETLRPVVAG